MNRLHKDTERIVYEYEHRATFNDVLKDLQVMTLDINFLLDNDYFMERERKIFKCERCMKNWTFQKMTYIQNCSVCFWID